MKHPARAGRPTQPRAIALAAAANRNDLTSCLTFRIMAGAAWLAATLALFNVYTWVLAP